MTITLRPYQIEAARAFMASGQRSMIVLPTGTGKTVLGIAIARYKFGRTLWLAHRDELITQPFRTCAAVWPAADRGIVKAATNQPNKQIVFASVQTACVPSRLQQLGGFDLVVADECHHAAAKSWRTVLEHLGCMTPGGPRLLGLTATPERADNVGLDSVFSEVCYVYHLQQAVEDGYLVPVRHERRDIDVDLDKIKRSGGDFNQVDLAKAMMAEGIRDEICDAVQAHPERKSIVFCVSIDQSHQVSDALRARGIAAAAVSGKTPRGLRQSIIQDLRNGKIQCVCNAMVFTEGFDEPSVDMIVMARPTESKPLWIQAVGRGLRISPNKTDCLVVDMVGASQKHNLIQAPAIFGEAARDTEARQAAIPDEDMALQAQVAMLERQLQGVGGEATARSDLRWVPCEAEGRLAMQAGGQLVIMQERPDGQWDLSATTQGGGLTSMASGVSMELAQGIAEDYVRRCDRHGYANKQAGWRGRPASKAQLQALRAKPGTKLSGGEASDLIVQRIARRYEPATQKQKWALIHRGLWQEGMTKAQAAAAFAESRKDT